MLRYKVNILQALKEKGYNSGVLRRRHILGETEIQKLREGVPVGIVAFDRICGLLHKQPGALLEWVPDPAPEDRDNSPGGVE